MSFSPSIVPWGPSQDVFLVLDQFGERLGRAWRETDENDTDYETLIRYLLEGQCNNPVRVVAFNTAAATTRNRGHLQRNFPGGKVKREQASTCIRIQSSVGIKPHVGVRDIYMVLICGRAPHDPSQRTTFADPRLPKDFALLVRIQRVNDAGFLPDNQDTLSASHTHQDRRLTKVVVWTIAFRTVGPSTEARRDEAIVCGSLPMPEHP